MPSSSKAAEPAPKPSRARFARPTELSELFELCSWIPPGEVLPKLEDVIAETQKSGLDITSRDAFADRMFDECFKWFSNDIKSKFVKRYARLGRNERELETSGKMAAVLRWYPYFVEFRRVIFLVAEYFEYKRRNPFYDKYGNLLADPNRPLAPWIAVRIASGHDNRLSLRADPLSRFLEGVDGDRIRKCANCERIFWAKRIDSRACSPNCSNILRQRDFQKLPEQEKRRRKVLRSKRRKLRGRSMKPRPLD